MKKTLLLAFITAIGFTSVKGQTFTTQNAAMGDSSTASGSGIVEVYNKLKSTNTAAVKVSWRITAASTTLTGSNPSWTVNGFCDNVLCYTNATQLLAGQTYTTDTFSTAFEDFHALLDGTNAPVGSSAWIQVRVTDQTSGYQRMLTFIATKTPTGVNSVKASDDDVQVYPNPAHDHINVRFDGNLGVKNVAIYNMIGKTVSYYRVQGSSAGLPLTDIPSGIYFIRLMDAQGHVVATRRFTHQ